jgi:hypothetical protein
MPVAKINTPDKYVFGRPAVHDVKKLAEHLNEWSKDDRNWDLCKWVDEVDIDPRTPARWAESDTDFGQAWNKAKNRIAARRTEMHVIAELPASVYNKYQHNYDVMHHEFEESLKDKDAKRQAKAKAEADAESAITPEIKQQFQDMMTMLSKHQSKSDLNKAESNIKSEQ